MAAKYDPQILQEYADALYRQASWVVVSSALQYGCVFLVISLIVLGLGLPAVKLPLAGLHTNSLVVAATILGAGMGYLAGRRKAFDLKLEAQQTLCQRAIELNTRAQGKSSAMAA
jgi:hypothetical protein